MSATTSRRTRTENTESNAPAPDAPPATDTSAAALATAEPRQITVEIAGLQVTLPLKFSAGHALTDNQAKILDAAYQRQFTNNMNANAKARAENLVKATATNNAADMAKYAPLDTAGIAALYSDYEPNVGGGPRMGSMEKMRLDAAWRAWVKLVTEHNEAIKVDGGTPVITKAGNKPVAIQSAPRKTDKVDILNEAGDKTGTRDATDQEHTARVEAFNQARDNFKARMLTLPAYADRIQAELDAIMAERGSAKATPATADVVSSADALL